MCNLLKPNKGSSTKKVAIRTFVKEPLSYQVLLSPRENCSLINLLDVEALYVQ